MITGDSGWSLGTGEALPPRTGLRPGGTFQRTIFRAIAERLENMVQKEMDYEALMNTMITKLQRNNPRLRQVSMKPWWDSESTGRHPQVPSHVWGTQEGTTEREPRLHTGCVGYLQEM